MIEARELTKRYGDTTAVHSLSFTIAPGTVTGFLGPNGAGKSTTMRMIMGLDRPTSGTVTVNGKPYRQHRAPLREVGALLEASAVHPGRSARSHLRSMAATHKIKASRVSEVIEMTGLAGVATKRVGGFSLGMGQRLGIAAALLGDPRTLILDEPVNELDPEGVQWVRQLVRALAAEGRTDFLSSHLMSEMSQTADQLLVIGRGRIIAAGPVQQVIDSVAGGAVRVRSPRAGELAAALAADGATVHGSDLRLLRCGVVRLGPGSTTDRVAAPSHHWIDRVDATALVGGFLTWRLWGQPTVFDEDTSRAFGIIVGIDLAPAWVAFVVGVHLFPVAVVLSFPLLHVVAAAVVIAAVLAVPWARSRSLPVSATTGLPNRVGPPARRIDLAGRCPARDLSGPTR